MKMKTHLAKPVMVFLANGVTQVQHGTEIFCGRPGQHRTTRLTAVTCKFCRKLMSAPDFVAPEGSWS